MTKIEIDGRGQVHTRKERLQRFIALDIQLKDTGKNTTLIQLDFAPRVEGTSFFACDSIISGVTGAIETKIGPGEEQGSAADTSQPAPPWWLLG